MVNKGKIYIEIKSLNKTKKENCKRFIKDRIKNTDQNKIKEFSKLTYDQK